MDKKTKNKKEQTPITDEQIAQALIKTNGTQYLAAKILQRSGCFVSERISQSKYLKQVQHDIIQARIDNAEVALDDLVGQRNPSAVFFTLKTLGRSRGYIEHQPQASFDPVILQQYASFFASLSKETQTGRLDRQDDLENPSE